MEILTNLDRDCSALAGLFQIIVNDLKTSGPMWEDFLTKASKLQNALKTTLSLFSTFLDAFQKIADCATHTRGATKEVGAALTRLSLRQRAIETRVKNLTNSLMTCLVVPLQDKMEDWRKAQHHLDKEHTKEYKRVRLDIKKRTDSLLRLQRKTKKGSKSSELNRLVQSSVDDLVSRYGVLEETERTALRHALREERARYCSLAHSMKPVLEEEVGLVSELGHLKEVMTQLEKHSADPHVLPAASEQVLEDVKTGESKWAWQTPPSSPTSSLGSRKSSMCSISSLNSSSSSSAQSPSHSTRQRSVSQKMMRMVSGSSQDSGFLSQDTLHRPVRPMSIALAKSSGLSDAHACSEGHHTPSPAGQIVATWPNSTDGSLQHKSASSSGLHSICDRPHTISSAYERGKERTPLTAYTFQPPQGSGPPSPRVASQPPSPFNYEIEEKGLRGMIGHLATISRRSSKASLQFMPSSSQESLGAPGRSKPPLPFRCGSLERPSVPEKEATVKLRLKQFQARPAPARAALPDFHKTAPDMIVPQPVYSNMAELKCDLAGSRVPPGGAENTESDGGSSHASLGSSGYGSQPNMAHEPAAARFEEFEANSYCTLRPQSLIIPPPPPIQQQIYAQGGFAGSRSGSLRRGTKPPPPVRRSSNASATGVPFHPPTRREDDLNSADNRPSSSHSSPSRYDHAGFYAAQNSSTSSSSSGDSQHNSHPSNRTDSESSTPVGSMENFPPPPAFLLEGTVNGQHQHPLPDGESKTPQAVAYDSGHPFVAAATNPVQECIQMRKISVSETVKSLQEKQHQPPSPLTYRRNHSHGKLNGNGFPDAVESRPDSSRNHNHVDSQRSSVVAALSAKISGSFEEPYSLDRRQRPSACHLTKSNSVSSRPSQQQSVYASTVSQSYRNHQSSSRSQKDFEYGSEVPFNSIHGGQFTAEEPFRGKPLPNKTWSRPSSNSSSGRNSPLMRPQNENQISFIHNLNMVLSQRVSNADGSVPGSTSPRMKPKRPAECTNGSVVHSASTVSRSTSNCSDKTSKVRQWMSAKKNPSSHPDSTTQNTLKESLLDQIRKGTSLRRAKHVADRSAPRVY